MGAATVTAPATWDNRDLPVYFTRTASNAARTPTRVVSTTASKVTNTATSDPSASSSPVLSTGAIAGIAVGGAAVIVFIAVGCFLCLRRRKRKTATPPPATYTAEVASTHYAPTAYSATPYGHQYPQQNFNIPELPDESQVPVYQAEPKYDSTAGQAFRNGSMQEHGQQGMEGAWTQHQGSIPSPNPSQHYYSSPTHSPPPSNLTPVRSHPQELSGSRPGVAPYPASGSYTGPKPGTPGSERHYQY